MTWLDPAPALPAALVPWPVLMGTADRARAAGAGTGPDLARVLVASHRDFLGFLERRVGDRALAEDILQDAFIRGLDKLDTVRDRESAIAWFYRLLRNAVIDHLRQVAAGDRRLAALASELEVEAGAAADVRDAVCRCVGDLAATLKPEYAAALRRIEIDGMGVKDYALEAGISSANAAVRVFRARAALRKQVMRSCGTCAEHGCLDCTCARCR